MLPGLASYPTSVAKGRSAMRDADIGVAFVASQSRASRAAEGVGERGSAWPAPSGGSGLYAAGSSNHHRRLAAPVPAESKVLLSVEANVHVTEVVSRPTGKAPASWRWTSSPFHTHAVLVAFIPPSDDEVESPTTSRC